MEEAPHLHAPRLLLAVAESELAEGNRDLRGPTFLVARHLRVPDRIPVGILLVTVLRDEHVALDSRAAHGKGEGGAVIEIAIEVDGYAVTFLGVSSGDTLLDELWLAVFGANGDVEVPLVIGNLEPRLLGGRFALVGPSLEKTGCPFTIAPAGVVQPAVDDRSQLVGDRRCGIALPLEALTGI